MREALFGLIMTLTFTLRADLVIQEEGREGTRQMLIGILAPEEATRIIDNMECTVRNRWDGVARREGVSEQDCAKVAGAFAYEGFRHPPGEHAAS